MSTYAHNLQKANARLAQNSGELRLPTRSVAIDPDATNRRIAEEMIRRNRGLRDKSS